jgi:glutaredoxin
MRRGLAGIALIALLAAATAQAQSLYRWVDKDGKVTYSQSPPPSGAAKSVQQKNLSSSVVESTTLPYAAQVAARNFPVTLYASRDCGPTCEEARASLQKRGIPFREISVSDDKGFEALKKLTGGKTQVPVVQIGSRTLQGYEAASWKSALDEVGYPASIPQPSRSQAAKAGMRENLPLVRLFTAGQCGRPCQDARDFLAGRGVPFVETSADAEAGAAEIRKFSESGRVPLLVVGTTVLDNYEPSRYDSVIEAAGFPRPALPPRR